MLFHGLLFPVLNSRRECKWHQQLLHYQPMPHVLEGLALLLLFRNGLPVFRRRVVPVNGWREQLLLGLVPEVFRRHAVELPNGNCLHAGRQGQLVLKLLLKGSLSCLRAKPVLELQGFRFMRFFWREVVRKYGHCCGNLERLLR